MYSLATAPVNTIGLTLGVPPPVYGSPVALHALSSLLPSLYFLPTALLRTHVCISPQQFPEPLSSASFRAE